MNILHTFPGIFRTHCINNYRNECGVNGYTEELANFDNEAGCSRSELVALLLGQLFKLGKCSNTKPNSLLIDKAYKYLSSFITRCLETEFPLDNYNKLFISQMRELSAAYDSGDFKTVHFALAHVLKSTNTTYSAYVSREEVDLYSQFHGGLSILQSILDTDYELEQETIPWDV